MAVKRTEQQHPKAGGLDLQPPEAVLRRFASAAAQVGITVRVPSDLPHPGLVKQDRETAAAFRVKNWPEFSKALVERDIEKRAFGYPI